MPTTTTFLGSGMEMLERVLAEEAPDEIIDVGWFRGFPYKDIPHVGSYVCVTSRGDGDGAVAIAKRIAAHLWERRGSFVATSLSAWEAVAQVQAAQSHPVVNNENSDNREATGLRRASRSAEYGPDARNEAQEESVQGISTDGARCLRCDLCEEWH
ncbi:MAG: M81 family metallopeptidase, partial [Myxococcales bacterium]